MVRPYSAVPVSGSQGRVSKTGSDDGIIDQGPLTPYGMAINVLMDGTNPFEKKHKINNIAYKILKSSFSLFSRTSSRMSGNTENPIT